MKDYLSVIRSARLFSGISEEELTPMLTCLKAEKKDFTKAVSYTHLTLPTILLV